MHLWVQGHQKVILGEKLVLHQRPVMVDVEDNACQVVRTNVSLLANKCDPVPAHFSRHSSGGSSPGL